MQSSSLPDRNFNNRVYETDTNSKNPIDSFHFKSIGMAPSLLSRMVDRASIDSSGETCFVDQQQYIDTSQADSSEALGSSAKSLLARMGLNAVTMPLNGLSGDTDALIDVHAEQNPEYNLLPNENTGADKSSVLKTNATTSENTRSQPTSESSIVASTNADGIVVTHFLNNDFTRSPTLVSDGKDDLVESGPKESRSCELTATYISPERGSGLSLEENVSASPVVRDLSTHDNGDQSILTYSITDDRTLSADVTSTLIRLPSTESTRFQPIHSDPLSFGHQSIAPILSSVLIPRQPSPDPFKRMFASVFDEATAAWEEEARHRETLGPPQRLQIERVVVQGTSTPDNQRPSRTPNPIAISTSSHSSGKERSSNPGPQESFPIHGDSQTVPHPVGHASALLTDISTVTIPPSSKTCVASPRAVTGAPIVSHPIMSTAESTASSSCTLQTTDSRHITHGQKEDLEYVNVASTSQTNVDVKPAAIQTRLDGSTNEVLPSYVPTDLNLHTATRSTESALAENPFSGKRSDLKSVVGGVILDARQLHNQSSASNITPLAERPPQIREVDVLRPSPQQTVPPVANAEDSCQSQGQSTKLPASDHFEPDRKVHSVKGSVLPPGNANLVYSKKDSPVSRPLKRRLSSSPSVKKEEDSASYTSTESKMSHAFLRPSKIKKIEDDDEKPLLKVESREDKLISGFDGRKNALPAVSGTQNLPHVEEKHDQLIRGISPMSFRYPSDPPQPLTTHPIMSTTVEGNSSKHELVNIASSSIAPSGEESAMNAVRSKRSLLILPPATPTYPERPCHPEIDARVGRERSLPTRELITGSGSEVPVDHGRNASRTRYLRDVRRSPPRRARSPIHRVDHYSPFPAPRYAPSDRYVWDVRRRSTSPGRSLSPRRHDPRYVDSRYSEYVLRRSRSPPPYTWARNPPSPQERFADPIALGHHSFSARAPESRPNVFYRDLQEDRRYPYEASIDFFIGSNGPGPEDPRQRGRSPDIDHNGPSGRNRNTNAMSPLTTVGQLASHLPHQPEIHERVSAPVQVSSSLISRMEGKAQTFNANAPRQGPKRKTSVTHALPPKPGFRTPSDGANTDKLHVKPVTAVQFSDRIEPLTHSRTTENRTSLEDKKLTAQLNQARYRPTDPQGAASSAHQDPRTSHPQAKNSPSLLPRIDAPTTVTRNKELPPNSRAVLKLETEGRAKVRQAFPKVKMQNGPSSPGGSGRRNEPRLIPQQDKPDLKRRISNSSQSPSSSPVTREFNAHEQQGNLLNRISQLERAPASNRGNHNNHRSFPPSPRTRQNSQYIHNNSTAPQPPYRAPEPLSPSPGDKLARRIK